MKSKLLYISVFTLLSLLGSSCSLTSPAIASPFSLPATPAIQEYVLFQEPASSDLQPVSVTASSSLPESPASYAVDGDPETNWNSGADAEQWIQLDLGAPKTINAIRLLVSQYPAGDTIHQVWAGADPQDLTLVYEFKGFTNDGDLLEFVPIIPPTEVQFIKIITTQSTSWVAWREIEIVTR